MSYVVIDLQQKASDAQELRQYLLDNEDKLPKTLRNTLVHHWIETVAGKIDEQAKGRLAPARAK